MHSLTRFFFVLMLFFAAPFIVSATDEATIQFTIDPITEFSISDGPTFQLYQEDIGGAGVTNYELTPPQPCTFSLSSNLQTWKVQAKIDSVLPAPITIKVKLEGVEAGYSTTSNNEITFAAADTNYTLITGENGVVANAKKITYTVVVAHGPSAGNHEYSVTYTVSDNP